MRIKKGFGWNAFEERRRKGEFIANNSKERKRREEKRSMKNKEISFCTF